MLEKFIYLLSSDATTSLCLIAYIIILFFYTWFLIKKVKALEINMKKQSDRIASLESLSVNHDIRIGGCEMSAMHDRLEKEYSNH